jgi:hypothetical protein
MSPLTLEHSEIELALLPSRPRAGRCRRCARKRSTASTADQPAPLAREADPGRVIAGRPIGAGGSFLRWKRYVTPEPVEPILDSIVSAGWTDASLGTSTLSFTRPLTCSVSACLTRGLEASKTIFVSWVTTKTLPKTPDQQGAETVTVVRLTNRPARPLPPGFVGRSVTL